MAPEGTSNLGLAEVKWYHGQTSEPFAAVSSSTKSVPGRRCCQDSIWWPQGRLRDHPSPRILAPVTMLNSTSTLTPPPSILCVFAHPDDEQFGTAGALLACAERGIAVHVLCATRGDAGEISDPALATPDTLGAVREEEMRDACRLLGFAEPIFLDHRDGALANADPDQLVREVVSVVRRVRPRVVLTFDANGGYGHPDHIAIHGAAVAAFDAAADPAFAPELGAPHRPDKLYVTAYPRSLFPRMNDAFVAAGFPPLSFGDVQTVADAELGTADERITTAVPVAHLWKRRWASLLAHRTQYGPGHPFLSLPDGTMRRWMEIDVFVRLRPSPPPSTPLPDEDDLWAGLPVPA